jgi:hypothetical protein
MLVWEMSGWVLEAQSLFSVVRKSKLLRGSEKEVRNIVGG